MANTNGKQINPVVAGLAGAAVGAGVAMVTARVLADQKMRDRIMNTASGIGRKAGMLYRNRVEKPIERVSHEISRGKRKLTGGRQRRSKRA